MLFFSILLRRTKRVFLCLKRSLPEALALTSALLFILFVFSYFYFGGDISYGEILRWMFVILAVMWGICFFGQLRRYSLNIFHRFDDDLIGRSFTKLNKTSALFEQGLELFHRNDFRRALLVFTELDDDKYPKSAEEQGVLSFYRGRCYHILGLYPNALVCYEKAEKNGFFIPVMHLFNARCCAGNGDTERAMEIYKSLLDTDYKHSDIIRTDIGQMYLKLNDGENALKWFNEAIDRRENYADALGGAAIAHTILHHFKEGEELYRAALLNHIEDSAGFKEYYKEIQAAALLETHQPEYNKQ